MKFSVPNYRLNELDVELNFTWIPPVLQLHELQNVVSEGDELSIEPFVFYRGKLQVIGEYSLGPDCDWLSWDYVARAFRGRVPGSLAADIGAERHETYTTTIELTAIVSWLFPSDIVFQRVYRCALPITVKRSVDRCDAIQEAMKSPNKPPYPLYKSVSRPELAVMQRPPTHRSLSYDCDKENAEVRSISEDAKLLRRKAESLMRSPSPIQMNSLSLARFYDAAASAPFGPPLQVRAMCDIRYGPDTSSTTNEMGEMRLKTPSPSKSKSPTEPLDLGNLRINKRGELVSSSDSEGSVEQRHDSILSPPAMVITPPLGTPQASAKKGKRPLRELLEEPKQAEEHLTCYTCKAKGRNPNGTMKEGLAICLTCRQSSFFDRVLAHISIEQTSNGASARQNQQSESHRRTTAEWQAEIKENYKEFETQKEGTPARRHDLDITMHDVVDSDENLEFSQLEVEEQ